MAFLCINDGVPFALRCLILFAFNLGLIMKLNLNLELLNWAYIFSFDGFNNFYDGNLNLGNPEFLLLLPIIYENAKIQKNQILSENKGSEIFLIKRIF